MKKEILLSLVLMGAICGLHGQNADTTSSGTFVDTRDGHSYKWVKIGTQSWMAENLAYLPSVSPSSDSSWLKSPYYYVYGYEGRNLSDALATENYATHGVLYNWKAATTSCPSGWHLPLDAEWTTLTDFLGESPGNKMKGPGTTERWSQNTGASNASGFAALPGGRSGNNGGFFLLGDNAFFWSASPYDINRAWYRTLTNSFDGVNMEPWGKRTGLSIRCLKNGPKDSLTSRFKNDTFTDSLGDVRIRVNDTLRGLMVPYSWLYGQSNLNLVQTLNLMRPYPEARQALGTGVLFWIYGDAALLTTVLIGYTVVFQQATFDTGGLIFFSFLGVSSIPSLIFGGKKFRQAITIFNRESLKPQVGSVNLKFGLLDHGVGLILEF